ncbi:hypothetical protein [Anoxynatronum buryatiense]|uniref:DUF1508 domain-containing protein n=1 Tax=Anoxynatronum buryatiense TaxID=489973 RepID=A0AA45WW53_9CLOT|nr:hypothetical protein [Anoxynatronum buryatiense]SMP55312.1 hypothetical protein SAMN06296020_105234 [Anoxynatronum buryatiense]
MSTFHIKKNPSGRFYFVFHGHESSRDDTAFSIASKSYTDRAQLEESIVQLRKFSDLSEIIVKDQCLQYPCFAVREDEQHRFYFHVFGLKGDLVMTSQPFSSWEVCLEGVQIIKKKARESKVLDLT